MRRPPGGGRRQERRRETRFPYPYPIHLTPYTADGSVMHRYGPRVVEGIESLARLIHPEAFVK